MRELNLVLTPRGRSVIDPPIIKTSLGTGPKRDIVRSWGNLVKKQKVPNPATRLFGLEDDTTQDAPRPFLADWPKQRIE